MDGGDDGGGSNDGSFTLTVAPTTLTLPIASSMTVAVTVSRTGTVGDIALTSPNLPGNLTATFSPESLPEGTDSAELTITAVGGMGPGTGTVTVRATGGGADHDATISVTTTTITVTGTVRGGRAGVKVGIIGKPSVTSGAGGAFSFTDVTPPYDLYTFADSDCGSFGPDPTVYYFDDLTRADPTVTAPAYSAGCFFGVLCSTRSAVVSGTKSGTGDNTSPVLWSWSEGNFNSPTLNTNGTFSGTATWCDTTNKSGTLRALQFTRKPNNAPGTFLGFAAMAATYANNIAATTNLSFAAVTGANLTGTIAPPNGFPPPSLQLTQDLGGPNLTLWTADTSTIDAAFPMSVGRAALYATSSGATGTSSFVHPLTAAATFNMTMLAPAELTAPAANATGVTTTTPITWTGASAAVHQVSVSSATNRFVIFTTKNEMTIPVIPELVLQSATSFTWSIVSYGPATSVNDAAGPTELETVVTNDFAGSPHSVASSLSRTFTTQ